MRGPDRRIVVIGAGMGGLSAAIECAARGHAVTLVERAPTVGGKMREVTVAGRPVDSGPTVFTMRWVFEELFRNAGAALADRVRLTPFDVIARHAWSATERLDLFRDRAPSADAIARFAGPAEGRAYLAFCEDARTIFETVERPVMLAEKPDMLAVARRARFSLDKVRAFTTMWRALSRHFADERLKQLFGRFATYCGSSPFRAPGTLMLVAHVEQEGVWSVNGGMYRLAEAMERLARECGVTLRTGTEARAVEIRDGRVRGVRVAGSGEPDGADEVIPADAVVVNADAAAVANGLFGAGAARAVPAMPEEERSLSAVTYSLVARPEGFPLARHTVFFSQDYPAEFDDIFERRRLPASPTVYVCGQDRLEPGPLDGAETAGEAERFLMIVNAPASGDASPFNDDEIERCHQATFGQLRRCGLTLLPGNGEMTVTDPTGFHRLFPATGGALYGRANHSWGASMARPTPRTRVPGLYLAGGSVHPGPGVPMAALSGRIAAACLERDLVSTRRSVPVATFGGMSTG